MAQTRRLTHRLPDTPRRYYLRLVSLLGRSSILAHWPLSDLSGLTADELINAYDATYTGGTLANATSKVGKPMPSLAGGGGINIGIAALLAAANMDEGAFIVTCKMNALANWGAATQDYLFRMASAADTVRMYRTANAFSITGQRSAQAESKAPYIFMWPTADTNLILSWSLSGGYVKLYQNGMDDSGAATATGVTKSFQGPLDNTKTRLFAMQSVPTAYAWRGWANDAVLLNRPVTDAEALAVSRIMLPDLPTMSFIGDSISAASNGYKYTVFIANDLNGGYYRRIHHAVSGAGILDGSLATQVTAAANDNADIIIIHIGTNDDDAGNMTTLQNTMAAQLAVLKASNPRAAIYVMNVLPRWTDVGGGTEVDKSHIRTAIAAACTAQGIACWDTYTDPWITAALTADGTHPTSVGKTGTGHAAIAVEIETLLS